MSLRSFINKNIQPNSTSQLFCLCGFNIAWSSDHSTYMKAAETISKTGACVFLWVLHREPGNERRRREGIGEEGSLSSSPYPSRFRPPFVFCVIPRVEPPATPTIESLLLEILVFTLRSISIVRFVLMFICRVSRDIRQWVFTAVDSV